MLIALWSATGGSGTSVLTAACSLVLARQARDAGHATGVRVADLAGDLPAVFGLGADPDVGLADWLDAGAEAPTEALDRLLVEDARAGVVASMLPRGRGPRVPTVLPAARAAARPLGIAAGAGVVAGAGRPAAPRASLRSAGSGRGRRRRDRRAARLLPRAASSRARATARTHRRRRPARRTRSIPGRNDRDRRGARPAGPRPGSPSKEAIARAVDAGVPAPPGCLRTAGPEPRPTSCGDSACERRAAKV